MVKAQSTPEAPSEPAHSAAAVTPTGPPANSRKRRLLLSTPTPRDGNDLSVGAAEANGEPAGAIEREEEETAT